MRLFAIVIGLGLLAGCATAPDANAETDDGEAETATAQAVGKADGASFVGLYKTHSKAHQSGDVITLQLLADDGKPGGGTTTAYVRERCYRASCALPLPETDRYDTYVSSGGKTYVRFWSFTKDAVGTTATTPAIADVYEIRATSYGIKLRKSYTTRWVSLYRTTGDAQCTASGGIWNGADCACPLNVPTQFPTQVFVAGGGGCVSRPGDNESHCDDSNGLWADDDATLTGAYCVCGLGRYDDATGTCAAI